MSRMAVGPTLPSPAVLREEDIPHAARAAELVVETHRIIGPALRAGMTLAQIDRLVAQTLDRFQVVSAFLHYSTSRYPAFPSYACLSVNDVVVHGTAGMSTTPLQRGDVISIDIGVRYKGWNGDAAWTYIIEEASEESRRLCECGIEALRRGVEQLQPGYPLLRWAQAVQQCVEKEYGYHCVERLGGHGLGCGRDHLHDPPHLANAVPPYPGDWPDSQFRLAPGMLLAVEPIIAVGTSKVIQRPRQWPIRTADGSLSVHYEHDVLITERGPRLLTAGLEDLPMIVG